MQQMINEMKVERVIPLVKVEEKKAFGTKTAEKFVWFEETEESPKYCKY